MSAFLTKTERPGTSVTLTVGTPVLTVLVVDDHEDTRMLLRYVFEAQHYCVSEASDGAEAVELAESIRPDVILMDTSLQRVDGLEATRRIRALACLRDVPIIFLSGHAQPTARAAALACGGNEYMVKPVSLDELEKVVEKQLKASRLRVH